MHDDYALYLVYFLCRLPFIHLLKTIAHDVRIEFVSADLLVRTLLDILCSKSTSIVLPSLPDPIFQRWIAPLSEVSPCGEDIGFSDEFESLRAEVEKGRPCMGGQCTDWPLVLRVPRSFSADAVRICGCCCYGVMAVMSPMGSCRARPLCPRPRRFSKCIGMSCIPAYRAFSDESRL